MNKKLQFVLWIIIAVVVLAGIGVYGYRFFQAKTETPVYPEATFEIENYGTVKIELYPEYAPNTVTNFIKLIEKGYYNGKVIYGKDDICMYVGRDTEGNAVNPKLSLISDDVEENSENDYDYTIKGEFIANGFGTNTLRHEKGVVSLIRNDYTQYVQTLRAESYDSGNAQIGIMMNDNSSNLNGLYAAFGKVTEGLDVLENIYNTSEIAPKEETEEAQAEESSSSIQEFKTYPVIKSATVDTHGIKFSNPIVEKAFDYSAYMYDLINNYYSEQ